jgi:hypothetical protein
MRRACVYLLALMFGAAACSSSATQVGSGGGGSSSTSPPPSSTHGALVTDAQNHRTVITHVGGLIRVRLGSTYWRLNAVAGDVLQTVGTPSFAPDPSCVPGGGCGTVTQTYRAVSVGTVLVTAARTVCGEALRCTPNKRSYSVKVVVRS